MFIDTFSRDLKIIDGQKGGFSQCPGGRSVAWRRVLCESAGRGCTRGRRGPVTAAVGSTDHRRGAGDGPPRLQMPRRGLLSEGVGAAGEAVGGERHRPGQGPGSGWRRAGPGPRSTDRPASQGSV